MKSEDKNQEEENDSQVSILKNDMSQVKYWYID